jgi:hypothetical protein
MPPCAPICRLDPDVLKLIGQPVALRGVVEVRGAGAVLDAHPELLFGASQSCLANLGTHRVPAAVN